MIQINAKNIVLPKPATDTDYFQAVRPFGDHFLYVSGMGPIVSNERALEGKIPTEITMEEGIQAAKNAALNALGTLQGYLGDLGRVKRFIKLLVFVASDPKFCEQHIVANGASQILIDLFGEEVGKAARSAIGVTSLPNNYPVEVEMLVEI